MPKMSKMSRGYPTIVALLLLGLSCSSLAAAPLTTQKISERVYALVGPYGQRAPDNLGNNATFGVVITGQGVLLIDSGGTYQGAAAIHTAIRTITDQPVRWIINTGGQDHRWLGNGYFKALGAEIIASRRAVEDQRARTQDQLFVLGNLVGDAGLKGTAPVYADRQFDDRLSLTLGGVSIEIHHVGQAHTPGDAFVWLPGESTLFSGDIVYIGRMLGVMPHSNSRSWIAVFNTMAAFAPTHLVPGHGPATDLATARKDTLSYLVGLREQVEAFMDEGRGIEEIGSLDQSAFAYLVSYDELKGRNAQQVFQEMEWE